VPPGSRLPPSRVPNAGRRPRGHPPTGRLGCGESGGHRREKPDLGHRFGL